MTPTLGPLTGVVALDDANRGGAPELLDDSGTIARRILQLPDRHADVGAMLLRESIWRQREIYGDAAATAAVIYQTVYDQGTRYISAGGDAMQLRRHLEAGMRLMLARLQDLAQPIGGKDDIERLALSVCGDRDIAAALADIFDVLGAHSPVETRDGGRELRHEFFVGCHWDCKVPSNVVFEGLAGGRIELRNTAWLISDFALDDLSALVRLVTETYTAGFESLAIVAQSFSDELLAAQGANSRMPDFDLVYIQPTGLVDEQEAALEDLALITGGRALRSIAGHYPGAFDKSDLGESELAWLDRSRFGIIAGGGDEAQVASEIESLGRYYASSDDERRREALGARMGRLQGGSALVWVNGSSPSELAYRRELITRTVAALRSALLDGALPGGGTALLRCLDSLEASCADSRDHCQRAALRILIAAAQAPCKRLLSNAGHDAPSLVINEMLSRANGAGYDLSSGLLDDMRGAGALDAAAAVMGALRNGVSGAALALTVDTIAHRVNPPLAIDPGGLQSSSARPGNIELK